MFEIEYKGANAIIISTKKAKLIVDPKLSLVGLKDLNVKGAVELASEERFAITDPDVNIVIDGPGEYGVAGFDILGVAAQRHLDSESEGKTSTMYRVEIEGTRIGIIGNIYEKLSDDQLEQLGVLDILIVPIGGGGYTLDLTGAIKIIKMISPKIVIPVHYADASLRYEVPQGDLTTFINELGAPVETVQKYKFKPTSATPTALSVVEIKLS